ncbi:MAG: hypothetical protein R3C52_08270 [Hyphomonadaceae bacterium]
MLELRKLTLAVSGRSVVTDLDAEVGPGAPLAVVGLDAGRRAAFAKCLQGQLRPSSGEARLGGQDVRRNRRGVTAASAKPSRPAAALAEKALASRAQLIVFDAPATGLTGEARAEFLSWFADRIAASPAAIVVLASTPDEARTSARVVILADSKTEQAGDLAEVRARPATLAAARALAHPSLNLLPLESGGDALRLADGSRFHAPSGLILPDAGRFTLAFHPRDAAFERIDERSVRFMAHGAGSTTIDGVIWARLNMAGVDWLAPLAVGVPAEGMVAGVFVDPARIWTFDGEGRAIGV